MIETDRDDGNAEHQAGIRHLRASNRLYAAPLGGVPCRNGAAPGARWTAAHTRAYIPLLPSGPGGVDRLALRGAQPPARRTEL